MVFKNYQQNYKNRNKKNLKIINKSIQKNKWK